MLFRTGSDTLMDLRRSAMATRARYESAMARFGERGNYMLEVGEVVAASWGFGALNGYAGGKGFTVLGVPLDLAFGLGAGWFAFGNLGTRMGDHAKALAFGALGSYFSTRGAVTGNNWRMRGGIFAKTAGESSGLLGDQSTGGGSLADEALAQMVRPAA